MSPASDNDIGPLPSGSPEDDSQTLFLLAIISDEEDAAALRADLKRSTLQNYKIQRCSHIDEAEHLLQVCGFDLVYLRLDDFERPAAAVECVRRADPELSVVGLVSSRRYRDKDFQLPETLDATCLLEDLSPTLVATLTHSILHTKRQDAVRKRLQQERDFAIATGALASWTLDIETGALSISPQAAALLGLVDASQCPYLDDLLEVAHPEDQLRLKQLFELAVSTKEDLHADFRLNYGGELGPNLRVAARYRAGTPHVHPSFYGFVARESHATEDLQARIESANRAIQKALAVQDDAMQSASQELELLTLKVQALENPLPPHSSRRPDKSEATPPSKPQPPESAKSEPTIAPPAPEAAREPAPEDDTPSAPEPTPPPPAAAPTAEADDQSLVLKNTDAYKQVIRSIARKRRDEAKNTFPFDFSADEDAAYKEPNLSQDGFINAANQLVANTQRAHKLEITLSVETSSNIESEREKALLFEILQELLSNVVRHAQATDCIITLFRDEDEWILQTEDDGVGLENNLVSISAPLDKIGLFRIRTKLALKGGQLDITPIAPKGLIARARLPVNIQSHDAERA